MNNPPSHGPFSSPGMRGHSAAIEAMTLAARHQLGDKHAVTVEAAKGIDWDDLAKRGVAGLQQRCGVGDRNGICGGADLEREIEAGGLLHLKSDVVLAEGAEALCFDLQDIGTGRKQSNRIGSVGVGNRGSDGAGRLVTDLDSGSWDASLGGVGDDARDLSGLCEQGTGEEQRGCGETTKQSEHGVIML